MTVYVRSNRATRWGTDDWGRAVALERRPGPWHVVGDPRDRHAVCGVKLVKLGQAQQERHRHHEAPSGVQCRWCARGVRRPGAGRRLRCSG